MEKLSAVLRTLKFQGGVFLDVQLTAPWAVDSQVWAADCRPVLRNPSQMIAFHLVTKGRMQVSAAGRGPFEVQAGEIVILPRNDIHQLASASGLPSVPGRKLVQVTPNGNLATIRHGGGGEETHMICGFLGSDGGYHPLISALPPILKISVTQAASRGLIESSFEYAALQTAEGVLAEPDALARISELLFIEAIRIHAADHMDEVDGWVKVFSDPQIGRALSQLHEDIAKDWTVEGLADVAAMSRSAFMSRFVDVCGMPPIRYLTHWRLRTAQSLLGESARPIAQIAAAVGYESEASFSKAYKREFGMPPSAARQ